jgi:hypothetical protein
MASEHTRDTSGHENANASKGKKPFDPPRLTVYGDIATLTRTVGRTGIPDGGHGSNSRTSP